MKFKKTIIKNWVIWGMMATNALYMMYSKFNNTEIAIQNNGVLFSKILICVALFIFLVLFCAERFLFRKSRIRKFVQDSPKKLIVPFYVFTILGTAFAQASIIWGAEALKATGENVFIFVLYGISIIFLSYFFPWQWRLAAQTSKSEQSCEADGVRPLL